jgi:thioredoxin 1
VIVTVEGVALDNQNKNKKINLTLKIILPIIVIAVIVGIWFFKTYEKPREIADSGSSVTESDQSKEINNSSSSETITDGSQEKTASGTTVTASKAPQETANASQETATNPDFALAVSKLDLEKLKSYGLPIIIDFGADECIPCKEMAAVLKKLNAEWQGKVIVKFVDVWKYPNEADNFPLQVIPTQFFFDGQGKPFVPSDPEGMQLTMYSLKGTQEHVYTSHQGGLTETQLKAIFEEMGIK